MFITEMFDDTSLTTNSSGMPESEREELVGALNLRSGNVGSPDGHSDRVAAYAIAIGRLLDLSTETLRTLKFAAILHDIGKVGISRSIVNKLGRLSERELEIMRLHSSIAVSMLERVKGLSDCLPLIKHHHERFDGKGYPDRLTGHDIPLGSRIIAVAETFDILVSDLPWRNALTLSEALTELQASAGTQFDPLVVEAFLSAIAARQVQLPEELDVELEVQLHRKTH